MENKKKTRSNDEKKVRDSGPQPIATEDLPSPNYNKLISFYENHDTRNKSWMKKYYFT